MPPSVYNRIAAGEVVDRPYSVVKELVENAIDAGAKNIEVRIERGGKDRITVTDDGSGILYEDLSSVFLPHATSKIATAEDLNVIQTLGFRGEALASIASVAKVTISSKTEKGKGYRISCDGGELSEISECGIPNGTEVEVLSLFYHTPVREKFLKPDRTEEADITNFVARFILGHPEIAFTYFANGKKVYQSFGGSLGEALATVYGAGVISSCFELDALKNGLRIRGFIGSTDFTKPNRSYQSTFINGRYVINTTLQSAVHNAYGSYLMKRQYPFYVLFIDMPAEVVDVNVHPNKADVRFANNQVVYGAIYSVISAVLDGSAKALEYLAHAPKEEVPPVTVKSTYPEAKKAESVSVASVSEQVKAGAEASLTYEQALREIQKDTPAPSADVVPPRIPKEKEPQEKTGFEPIFFENKMEIHDNSYDADVVEEDAFAENQKFLQEQERKKIQEKIDVSAFVYKGNLFNTYLIYEYGTDVYLIDQHAAHERLIFDRLRERMANRTNAVQPMLFPYLLDVNASEADFLAKSLPEIRALGFEIDEFGNNSFKVSAIPVLLQDINLDEFFGEILSDISGLKGIRLNELLRDKFAMAACKAAVKGGMNLTEREVRDLWNKMDGNMTLKCPHGRPVTVKLTKSEIEKMFKRIV